MRVERPGTESGRGEATSGGFGTPRRPGRPRDPQADEAIISAIVDVLAEQGFSGFTVEEVAARAGVGKATIYRRGRPRKARPCSGRTGDGAGGTARHRFAARRPRGLVLGEVPHQGRHHERPAHGPGHRRGRRRPRPKKLLGRFFTGRQKMIAAVVERGRQGRVRRGRRALLMDLVSGTLLHRRSSATSSFGGANVVQVVDAALKASARAAVDPPSLRPHGGASKVGPASPALAAGGRRRR